MTWRTTFTMAFFAGVLAAAILPTLSPASPSAGDGEIAFSSSVHGISQVFTVAPDGTGERQITHGKSNAGQYGLSWSPDGRDLLYSVMTPQGPDVIVRSRADGSNAEPINPPCTGTCLGDDNAVYSPDGKRIAFERAFGPIVNNNASNVAIFTMNGDGSDLTRLTPKGTSLNSQPRWSPDGKRIAFVHFDGSRDKGAIEVMDADGGNVRRLTPFAIDATDPRWSPSGRLILFSTYADATPGRSANLFTMHSDGTNRVALTHYSGGTLQAFASDWSPDGTQIVFRRMAYSGIDTEVGSFFIFDVHSKQVRRLVHVTIRHDALAAWGRAG